MRTRVREWGGWWYAERWNGEEWATLYAHHDRARVDAFMVGYLRDPQ